MTNETRNRRFTRKSRPNRQNTGENESRPRRSAGIRAPETLSAPESPRKAGKSGKNARRNDKSGNNVKGRGREGGAGWIWGTHAVRAALANPKRTIHEITATENAVIRFDLPPNAPKPRLVLPAVLDRDFGPGHQGIAIKAAPLEWPDLQYHFLLASFCCFLRYFSLKITRFLK